MGIDRATIEAEWTPGADGILEREAARVVIFRPDGATYLIKGHDIDDKVHAWWFTVGGGYNASESAREGALRELAEETGLALTSDRLEGPVLERYATFHFALETRRQHEFFFLACLTREEAMRVGEHRDLTDLEKAVLDEYRWWHLDELEKEESSGELIYPAGFVAKARAWREGWDGNLEVVVEE